jgi:oxygen-independent coproporphyrinogen III oxidase
MSSPLGLYIHIPFCESKCDYCNFASGVYPESMVLPYLEALGQEILGVKSLLAELNVPPGQLTRAEVDSVYLGGGTPSLIEDRHIADLMRLVRKVFAVLPDAEVTLEVNPGTVDRVKMEGHLAAGVNRVSIGMQTFQDELLKRIGRSHSVSDSLKTLSLYRTAGLHNISLDLIAGLPGQTLEDWRDNLRQVESLAPDHVSLYLLEIHENTRFGKTYGQTSDREDVSDEKTCPPLPDEDLVIMFYEAAVRRFAELGYRHYEISNFAKPGKESRHNLKYWTDQAFIGFGCGAYSYFDGKRWGNERRIGRYIELVRQQHHAIDYRCKLSSTEREEEALFLGLRLTEGIRFPAFEQKFGLDLREKRCQQISYLREAGLVELTTDHLRLTPKGRMLSNEVFTELLR